MALILDNQVQEEKGIYEDGQVYLPVDWVNEHLNERFYWDEGEQLLVYAPVSYTHLDVYKRQGPTCFPLISSTPPLMA